MDHAKDMEPQASLRQPLYHCLDPILTSRALRVLRNAGFEVYLEDHASTALPLQVGVDAGELITVSTSHVAAARNCLNHAVEDGVLPGSFLI